MAGRSFDALPAGRGVMQSSIPKVDNDPSGSTRAWGLTIRGAVLAVYPFDSKADGGSAVGGTVTGQRRAVYCDVLCYGSKRVADGTVIPRVLVTYDSGAMHEGEITLPRAATKDITGAPLDPNSVTNPADLDASHVLVGFIDDDLSIPYLQRYLPHPNMGKGATTAPDLIERMRIHASDGEPWFHKHRGALVGISTNGNYLLDLRRAHDGVLNPDGSENPNKDRPDADRLEGPAPSPAKAGNFKVFLPDSAALTIEWDSGRAIELTDHDGKLVFKVDSIELGDGATEQLIYGDKWSTARQQLHNTLSAACDTLNAGMTAALAVAAPPVPATAASLAAVAALLTTFVGAVKAAITAFEAGPGGAGGPAGYLSANVKTR